jgi:hypothetical protein
MGIGVGLLWREGLFRPADFFLAGAFFFAPSFFAVAFFATVFFAAVFFFATGFFLMSFFAAVFFLRVGLFLLAVFLRAGFFLAMRKVYQTSCIRGFRLYLLSLTFSMYSSPRSQLASSVHVRPALESFQCPPYGWSR